MTLLKKEAVHDRIKIHVVHTSLFRNHKKNIFFVIIEIYIRRKSTLVRPQASLH